MTRQGGPLGDSHVGGERVGFVVAGAQKAGTTALRGYLLTHPQVCMTSRNEGHFFDRLDGRPSPEELQRYHDSFRPNAEQLLLGDNTPIYLYWYSGPKLIWEYNPEMRFVILLRNPVDRAFSHWNMERSRGAEHLDFWTAIQTEAERCRQALPLQHRVYSYVDRGFYTEQLRRLWHFFPRDQCLVIKSDDLKHAPAQTLDRLSGFLGLDPFPAIDPLVARPGEYTTTMSDRERRFLQDVFRFEVRELEQMLGWDCSGWLT